MEQIKVDIQGNTTISSQDWEEGWDMVSLLANDDISGSNGMLTKDSKIEGALLLPVCCKSERRRVDDRFASLSVSVDENLQQFEDREVCRAISNKYGGGSLMSKDSFCKMTSCNLSGNQEIKFFDEFEETSITTYSNNFQNCANLKRVGLRNITSISGPITFHQNAVLCFYNVKTHGRIGQNSSNGGRYIRFIAFPSLEVGTGAYDFEQGTLVIDIGNKVTSLGSSNGAQMNLRSNNAIVRASSVPTLKDSSGNNLSPDDISKLFVPDSSVSSYISTWKRDTSNTFPISGTEWQTAMRTLANQYAKEYAGWSADQIATADYSDPYIDYHIFGLEPPTE